MLEKIQSDLDEQRKTLALLETELGNAITAELTSLKAAA
jgi:hypothetical protein